LLAWLKGVFLVVFCKTFLTEWLSGLRELANRGPLSRERAHLVFGCSAILVKILTFAALAAGALCWPMNVMDWTIGALFSGLSLTCSLVVHLLCKRRMIDSLSRGGYGPDELR
jgi:hypothetical protein